MTQGDRNSPLPAPRPKRRWWIGYVLVLLTGILYGAVTVRYELPPYGFFKNKYRDFKSDGLATDATLLTIGDAGEAARRRSELIAFLWGEGGLPVRRVDSVETDGLDSRYTGLPSLAAIERLRIRMEFGLDSAAIHLRPERPNGTLVLLHQGHDHQPLPMELSAALLERGYSVLAISMPLYGENARPEIQFPSIGRLTLRIHEQLRLLEPAQGSQLKYFVEPVVVALNHLLPAHGYRRVAMIGLSGGGWTTTLAAAVDPRIAQSHPVAGSQPLDLTVGEAWPDFEQSEPTLYKRFSYLDLYLLGASGQGRRQVQVVNAYDPCCFRGRAAESYRGQVAERARRLGGDFDVLIDDTHEEHKI